MKMKKCRCCQQNKPDVKVRINPFAKEVHDQEIKEPLCDDCYQNLKDDI